MLQEGHVSKPQGFRVVGGGHFFVRNDRFGKAAGLMILDFCSIQQSSSQGVSAETGQME